MKAMMEKLNEQLFSVAKEYARLFGEVIGMEPEFWVSDEPFMCCFGDTMFFTLEEMRKVVDSLPEYIRKYGSREAVGQEIVNYTEWWLDGVGDNIALERILPRVTHQLRPNISLGAWLDGCPREDREPWCGPDADFMRLSNDLDTLSRLIKDYGPDNKLKYVYDDVKIELKKETAAKRKRDEEERRRLFSESSALNALSSMIHF